MNAISNRHLPLIGIVGGIGSGKSAVAKRLAEQFPIRVLDADRAGHTALHENEVKTQIRQKFGDDVFDEVGEVDRKALGRRVFGDSPECQQQRIGLEQIVHPRIRELLSSQIQSIRDREPTVQAIVLDAPVLFEAGWHEICDAIIFIDVPRTIRLNRLQEGRGWSVEELDRREASQISLEEKRARSDWTIDNTSSLDDSVQQFAEFWNSRFPTPLQSTCCDDSLLTQPHAN